MNVQTHFSAAFVHLQTCLRVEGEKNNPTKLKYRISLEFPALLAAEELYNR